MSLKWYVWIFFRQGDIGPSGVRGPEGPRGRQGAPGSVGPQGRDGTDGPSVSLPTNPISFTMTHGLLLLSTNLSNALHVPFALQFFSLKSFVFFVQGRQGEKGAPGLPGEKGPPVSRKLVNVGFCLEKINTTSQTQSRHKSISFTFFVPPRRHPSKAPVIVQLDSFRLV